ncbi:exonuclease 1-like [Rosa rugosa]|uniref:exonuclease 1-like n=1 Tax=Rosa rugosa TaxID=74645 RepID=UPI002B4146D1|nr:exonuclease 1-like [Rosa rugosa]
MGIGPPGISILKEMRQYMRVIQLDSFSELEEKTVGIDRTTWLVEANDKKKNKHQLSKGDYLVHKCLILKMHKITPLLVFDTLVPLGKDRNKEFWNREIHFNYVDRAVRECLSRNAIKLICAPYESDAELAYLMEKKYIYAVMTGDSDLMAYGVSRIIYMIGSQTIVIAITMNLKK